MYTEKKGELSFYNDMGILTLNAKQFDTGRKFSFSIIDNDEPFDMSGCTVSLRIQKADGTQFSSTECCTVEGSKVIIDTTRGNGEQILAASGINECELYLKDDNDTTLTTWNFNINVEKRVHNCENIRSSDSFDFIDNLTVSEKERIANEQAREENEINRIQNETQRIREFNDATTEINAFITNGELAMKNVKDIIDNFDKNINDIVDGITDKAQGFANSASESADIANEKAIAASVSETNADTYAKKSQSYAVGTGGEIRDGDDTDCAEYYYNQIRKISQGIGGVIPMGTISYEDLDRPENQKQGYLFNISDSFVSDERFRDGGGLFYGAGSNVLYTTDNMWDVLAASMVSGVKGASENEYRQGFVSLSAEDVGAAAKSDLDNMNPLNAFYNSSSNQLDTVISDLDYIKQHPYLFGHSDALSNSLGYWINVFNIKSGVFGQASQVAVGPNGMASRYHQHTAGTWSDWEISATKSDLDTLKQSFQAGCSTIANAISSNGVTTADNANPGTMAANIGQIRSDGTADASAILEGITAYAKGNKITGTMKNWKRTPQHIDAVRLANNRFEVAVAAGYHGYSWTENSYEYLEMSQVASTLGISAANIATGQTICGVTGTGTLYDKCFKYCYHNRSSVFYAKKEVLCIKTGETVIINWRDYLFNKEGAWYHTNGGAAQDWNGGVDPGVISYTYDNNTTSYTITGVKAGISVIRFRHAGGYSARIIVIVWDP